MAEIEAESGRRMGREPAVRQGRGVARAWNQYRVANGVGADWTDRGRVGDQRACDARRAMALRAAERRRRVGREGIDRQRISKPFLSSLPHVCALLSADGARALPKKIGGDGITLSDLL